jgi:hypothetical protein
MRSTDNQYDSLSFKAIEDASHYSDYTSVARNQRKAAWSHLYWISTVAESLTQLSAYITK